MMKNDIIITNKKQLKSQFTKEDLRKSRTNIAVSIAALLSVNEKFHSGLHI